MNERKIITVSVLNKYLKNKFDTDPHIQDVSLKGEISNFKGHTRGHLYFTLKDENSRISAVMFKYSAMKLKFKPEDGMNVIVTGKISIYEATGQYQVYINEMEEDGVGNLHIEFEKLKQKLNKEGLFDESHKKSLPKYPEKIGVITAPTGAAIRDIITTINRRYDRAEVILFPSLVQGNNAKDDLISNLKKADSFNLDLIIFGRGGGSIEDLWPFNEELVAREIYNLKTPIISGVGHEIDFTISDFVADLRAPTPTAAAELAVPNKLDLNLMINQYKTRLTNNIKNKLNYLTADLVALKNSHVLRNPYAPYEVKEEKLTLLYEKLNSIIKNKLNVSETKLNNLKTKHILINPKQLFDKNITKLELIENKLTLLNPHNILDKGYSIVKLDNKIIKDVKNIKENDNINITFKTGTVDAKVEKVG